MLVKFNRVLQALVASSLLWCSQQAGAQAVAPSEILVAMSRDHVRIDDRLLRERKIIPTSPIEQMPLRAMAEPNANGSPQAVLILTGRPPVNPSFVADKLDEPLVDTTRT